MMIEAGWLAIYQPRPFCFRLPSCSMILIGVISFRLGNCKECACPLDDWSHDSCYQHAYCNQGGCYQAAICSICGDLWDCARDVEDPQDAGSAFDTLAEWIRGFRRRFKNRPRGQDHFLDPSERALFQELHASFARARANPTEAHLHKQPRPALKPQQPPCTPTRSVTASFEEEPEVSDLESPQEPYIPSFQFVASPTSSTHTDQEVPPPKG